MNDNDLIPLGKIVGAHGVAGTVKIFFYAEFQNTFSAGDDVILKSPNGAISEHRIGWVKPHNRLVLVSFSGVADRDSAEDLKGSFLLINKNQLPEPGENTYYWNDLIGLKVETADGKYLGVLKEIIATGANDVYVIKDQKKEILIPAIAAVVKRVDLEERCMQVTLPE
jgi:16S rRNA processing protein RimM